MSAWLDWYRGIMAGISAPVDQTTEDAAWAWSCAESDPSGVNVMRWCNPLNSTEKMPGSIDSGAQPGPDDVQIYPSVAVGIQATVLTLLSPVAGVLPNGYDVIVANLRSSLPRQQWANASHQLGDWGTGTTWLNRAYPPPPFIAFPPRDAGGDSNMVLLGYGPNGRRDAFLIGRDFNLYHLSAPDDATFRSKPTVTGFPLPKPAAPGTLAASWNANQTAFVVEYADTTGQVYHGLVDDGGVVAGWPFAAVPNVSVALPPSGPAGPPGPPGVQGQMGPTGPTGQQGPPPDAQSIQNAFVSWLKGILSL